MKIKYTNEEVYCTSTTGACAGIHTYMSYNDKAQYIENNDGPLIIPFKNIY